MDWMMSDLLCSMSGRLRLMRVRIRCARRCAHWGRLTSHRQGCLSAWPGWRGAFWLYTSCFRPSDNHWCTGGFVKGLGIFLGTLLLTSALPAQDAVPAKTLTVENIFVDGGLTGRAPE